MMPLPTTLDGERLARHERYGDRPAPREARRSLTDALDRVRAQLRRG